MLFLFRLLFFTFAAYGLLWLWFEQQQPLIVVAVLMGISIAVVYEIIDRQTDRNRKSDQ